jgi:uncharacterized protein with HEPN domain
VDGYDSFISSTLIQDAVLRNLQILTESSQRISSGTKNAHPEINWRAMSAFRNILVHGYLGVNLDRVWETVENDLTELKLLLTAILRESGEIP